MPELWRAGASVNICRFCLPCLLLFWLFAPLSLWFFSCAFIGYCSWLHLVVLLEVLTLQDSSSRISNMLEHIGASATARTLRKLHRWTGPPSHATQGVITEVRWIFMAGLGMFVAELKNSMSVTEKSGLKLCSVHSASGLCHRHGYIIGQACEIS